MRLGDAEGGGDLGHCGLAVVAGADGGAQGGVLAARLAGDRYPRLPIGVATSTRVPATQSLRPAGGFEGFLPRSGSWRTQRLADLSTERRTIVLYEALHRLARTWRTWPRRCGRHETSRWCRS